ncbi:chondroitinase family polysaccharide lyase [Microbacterium sp. H1-D42]|uniref:chondroitinase family polysaccharide lyase n=1 Tax=Microbacterium sp. H1-D42 TaxID=2925844 RepID=UPI001F53245F|nr:chondroitinase family polysaccharide lyase [Microbacterium sp. H1-D42]UNK71278.1 hypothetical protein MNR00_02150 [Microbacterium sp. H1-D42]
MEISRRAFLAVGALSSAAMCTWNPGGPATAHAASQLNTTADAVDVEARAAALSPPIFLLETKVPRQFTSTDPLQISAERAKVGTRSLRWEHAARGTLTIKEPLRFQPSEYSPGTDQALMGTVATFAVWIYNDVPTSAPLRIEFGRGANTDAWFDFGLDFSGWRTCWVRLGYDTEGEAHPGMNRVRFVAPDRPGTLYIDQVVLNTQMRPDHHTPDAQVPFVQPEVVDADNRHWLDLLRFRQELESTRLPAADGQQDVETVRGALLRRATVAADITSPGLQKATADVEALGVPFRDAGDVAGVGSFINGYQSAIWPASIRDDVLALASGVTLRAVGQRMRALASASAKARAADAPTAAAFDELYLRMFVHLEDQGFAAGSAQGTIHHIGYQYREMADSFLVARDVLIDHGLWDRAWANLSWFAGLGRITHDFRDPADFGGVVDIQNTLVGVMAICAVTADSDDQQARTLAAVTRWVEGSLTDSPGVEGGIKPDGTIFHHMGPYPDYGRDALGGLTPIVALLHGTAFGLAAPARRALRRALLTMRLYANTMQWPLSLAGRHPTGVTGMSIGPFQQLAAISFPGEDGDYDREIGAAYLRLLPPNASAAQRSLAADLREAGITAEPAPSGHRALGYAACGLHRRDEWLVTLRGHNRYLWSAEIYEGANMYGRYLTYGSVEVQSQRDDAGQITHAANGFVQPGWDWNRIPGATTRHLPWAELRADLTGTIEQMPLTKSAFGGAGSWKGTHGVFGMHLIEHPKFDPTHTAKISRFSFDDIVICLGSDIGNSDSSHETETTLYQVAVSPADADGSDGIADLAAGTGITDPHGNGFYVAGDQRLRRIRAVQSGPDQTDAQTAEAPYATAVLAHGTAPRDGGYEYALVVGVGAQGIAEFTTAMSGDRAPYAVMRKDSSAHVVSHRASGVTGAACFDSVDDLDEAVRSVDGPALLMWATVGPQLALSVTDPDLHLYTGEDADQYDADGVYVGDKTSFSRPWRRSPSAPSWRTIVLAGAWTCDAADVEVSSGSGTTTLRVQCRDAATRDLILNPA